MMKFKKLAAIAMASLMVFAPSSAFAQETPEAAQEVTATTEVAEEAVEEEVAVEPELAVQLNGTDMKFADAEPIIVNGRVYVPFRAIFEGLKAEVAYDAETSKITVKKNDTEAAFTVGQKSMTVTKDGTTNTVETDVASFVQNGRTYVPVRFAEQALNCTVGWDAENRTVIIFDADEVKGAGETYTIMNKYLAYAKEFSEKTYALTGTFNFDVKNIEGSSDNNIKGVCKIDGITDSSNINMSMVAELDLTAIEKMLKADETTDAETLAQLENFKNINFNLIFSLDTGKYYIQSNLFSTLMGAAEGTWYSIDMNEMLSMSGAGFSFTDLAKMAKEADFESYMAAISSEIPTDDKYESAAAIQTYKLLTGLFSDNAFKAVADGYQSTYTQDTDGMAMTISMKITSADDKVTGYSIDMKMAYMGTEMMKLTAAQTGLKTTMNMTMGMDGIFDMTMTGNLDYSETTNKPLSAPKAGETVISLNDMFMAYQ
ncbi:MAG: copper amine oxidase N-terminal domain-containing protein [Lachnospiraceae bacterium]|nr:copper amine oxidase N-terminal domain-containing protein [Lachnospiraceae bacterium]